MLTRVYIDNFRSFVNFEYKPERKQLLLGANGSGKSSLLDAIRYLKKFVEGYENPFTQSTRTRWQDRPLQVVEIEALLDRQKYEYRIEIRFESETRQPSVSLESLRVSGAPVFELANGEIRFFQNNSSQATTLRLETAKSALHLSLLSNSHVLRFVEWLGTVHCFRIDEYPSAMSESADREERQPDDELENLAGWYRHLVQAHPDENLRFLNSMKDALDGFQALRFSSGEDGVKQLRADFMASTKGRINYSLSELSEGQRCLIALYMILHFLIAKGHTVFIDEPDNFIALREIQPWLLAAEEAVEDHSGQLILISHHPEILNQWASTRGLRFFREDNGHVRTEKFMADPKGDLQPSELIAREWVDE
ncbi:MAG: AAA family ATPase [Acidobacteriia bacterium]|nr:AAA family ATPase [Terriglobia bacterium]